MTEGIGRHFDLRGANRYDDSVCIDLVNLRDRGTGLVIDDCSSSQLRSLGGTRGPQLSGERFSILTRQIVQRPPVSILAHWIACGTRHSDPV